MFPAKAYGPTVFGLNSAGVDTTCCQQAKEGLLLLMSMLLVTLLMNTIAQSKLCSTNS
jgi:hypothetical protein